MYNLDFLSGSPNIFIFQKQSNKTTFGGFLFLLYTIIMILISLIYIIDYSCNDKYIVEYSSYFNTADKGSSNPFSYLNIFNKSYSEDNPIINISFNLFKTNESYLLNLSERFVLLDAFNGFPVLKRDTFYQRKVSELGFIIAYICEDKECSLNEEDFSQFDYYIEIKYSGFELNHQKKIPLKKDSNILFKDFYLFSFTHTVIKSLNWEVVKYKEIKGISRLFDQLLGNKNEYTGGYISTSGSTYINHPIINNHTLIPDKYTKTLGEFLMTTGHTLYSEYKRRKISLLDIVANIGSLFISLYSCFILVIKYYSNNFDNYKIIQSILNKKLNCIQKEQKDTKRELIEIKKDSNDNIMSNKDKNNSLINDKNDYIINDEDIDDIEKENNFNIKKLSFAQFFLNNIYCKYCDKLYEQEIIKTCNQIISKYLSVEKLLYNQMMLENLFKDYNWNNHKLKKIDNNELIIKLKNNF